jgi:hypothetical protein
MHLVSGVPYARPDAGAQDQARAPEQRRSLESTLLEEMAPNAAPAARPTTSPLRKPSLAPSEYSLRLTIVSTADFGMALSLPLASDRISTSGPELLKAQSVRSPDFNLTEISVPGVNASTFSQRPMIVWERNEVANSKKNLARFACKL